MIIFFLSDSVLNSFSYFKTAFLAINWKELIANWKFETQKSKLVFILQTFKHVETNQLISAVRQRAYLYMKWPSATKELVCFLF